MHGTVIVGGGISGLSAAFWLSQRGADVVVLEAEGEVGGTMRSVRSGGYLFERGPHSFVDNNAVTRALLDDSGVAARLVQAQPAGKRRYVFRHGALREVPSHPARLFRSGVLSGRGILRMLAEPFIVGEGADDETLADLADRRIGREAREALVEAFVRGIWAGDATRLSAEATAPRLVEAEGRYGSLALGLLASLSPGRPRGKGRPATASFAGGMHELPLGLAAVLGPERVRCGARVCGLGREQDGTFRVRYAQSGAEHELEACRLLLAVPSHQAAHLLQGLISGDGVAALREMPYAPVAVVGLGLPGARLPGGIPDGFGFLVPPGERLRILGCIFASRLFPGRAPEGSATVSVFVGGAADPGLVELDDARLTELVLSDLEAGIGLRADPEAVWIQRWERGIPQYNRGHVERRRRIEDAAAAVPGLSLCGNYLTGVSLHDCIARSRAVVTGAAEDGAT